MIGTCGHLTQDLCMTKWLLQWINMKILRNQCLWGRIAASINNNSLFLKENDKLKSLNSWFKDRQTLPDAWLKNKQTNKNPLNSCSCRSEMANNYIKRLILCWMSVTFELVVLLGFLYQSWGIAQYRLAQPKLEGELMGGFRVLWRCANSKPMLNVLWQTSRPLSLCLKRLFILLLITL